MGTPCQIDVKLAKIEGRKNATVKDRDGSSYKAPVFMVSTDKTFLSCQSEIRLITAIIEDVFLMKIIFVNT